MVDHSLTHDQRCHMSKNNILRLQEDGKQMMIELDDKLTTRCMQPQSHKHTHINTQRIVTLQATLPIAWFTQQSHHKF